MNNFIEGIKQYIMWLVFELMDRWEFLGILFLCLSMVTFTIIAFD